MIWIVLVLMSSMKYSFFLINELVYEKETFCCLEQFQNCHFEAPFHKRLVMHGSQLWRNGHRRESISAPPAGDGGQDINRNCSKPLETRFELLTKAQKSPDDDLGSNVYGLALGPVVLFSIYEMGNDVWKLKTDYSDLSPSMFSGSGGPSRDGGGGNEEDKMETEEEVMETYKCHLS